MPTVDHLFRVVANGEELVLRVRKPRVHLVSTEYYFTYTRCAEVTVRQPLANEIVPASADRFIAQAYRPEQIKMAVLRFPERFSPDDALLERLVETIVARSTQFPLFVIDGAIAKETLERLIEILKRLAECDDMYFLLLLKTKNPPDDASLFEAHKEVYYMSRNRIFLKSLLELDAAEISDWAEKLKEMRRRNIPTDLHLSLNSSTEISHLPKLKDQLHSWYDTYSEQEIVQGPNLWLKLAEKIPPPLLIELNDHFVRSGIRRIFFTPSLHRLFNGFATLHAGGIRGTLVFNLNGALELEELGESTPLGSWIERDLDQLLAGQSANDECLEDGGETSCGELKHFCLRTKAQCAYLQAIVATMAE